DLRDFVRLDEDEGGCGVDEPTNEPGCGGPVHADLPTRHPLHASPSLPYVRRAPSAASTRRLTSSQATFSMTAPTYFAGGAVGEMVGVLVHVERERRPPNGPVVHVVPRPALLLFAT